MWKKEERSLGLTKFTFYLNILDAEHDQIIKKKKKDKYFPYFQFFFF